MVDLTKFNNQMQTALDNQHVNYNDNPRDLFMAQLTCNGLEVPHTLLLDKVEKLRHLTDNPNKKDAWYWYTEFPDNKYPDRIFAIGIYASYKTEKHIIPKTTWTNRNESSMTMDEKANYTIAAQAHKRAYEEQQKIRHEEASFQATMIIKNAGVVNNHPYASKKKIKIYDGIKESGGNLLIPIIADNKIYSIETIYPDGKKRFMSGGRKKGCYFKIKGNDEIVYVCEGYSTGASIAEATGNIVYVAFDAGNLYEVCSKVKNIHANSIVCIAGDDDKFKKVNIGRNKAIQASDGLNIPVMFPEFKNIETEPTDFNDLHQLEGLESVRKYLTLKDNKAYEKKEYDESESDLTPPKGILREIYNFYNATSGNKQYGFAIQTALALTSILCARNFKTNLNNFSSLYLLNVGKSSTGKEHSKTVIEHIMTEAGHDKYIAGDGYTSAGGVFSALLDRPKHISIIDEFGRYLNVSGQNGNHHQQEANTKLMEAIGRCHSVIRPPSYSTMTLKKKDADNIRNRHVKNPAITLLTMTTPVTLFKSLNMEAIKDGFINRFIINISDADRSIRVHKSMIDVPEEILTWIDNIYARVDNNNLAMEDVDFEIINFSDEALELQTKFQYYCIKKANELEKINMEELSGRANEMAMRLSLITALSRDYNTEIITKEDMEWSIKYIKNCFEKTMNCLKMTISSSSYEGEKKEILQALRDKSPERIKLSSMRKIPPFSKYKKKDLQEILDSLEEAELIESKPSEGRGRPTIEYIAIK